MARCTNQRRGMNQRGQTRLIEDHRVESLTRKGDQNESGQTINYAFAGKDPTQPLFSYGRGSVFGSSKCRAWVSCVTGNSSWSCDLKYHGKDKFTEPFKVNTWGTESNFEPGTVYDMPIDWTEFIAK